MYCSSRNFQVFATKSKLFAIVLLFIPFAGNAQVFNYSANENPYSIYENDTAFYRSILDTVYGITIYENLNLRLGGDSVRNDKRGYAARGWIEDYYSNGELLHKGYYSEGQLKIYKNYYLNGQLERNFRTTDNIKSTMEKFYVDGTMKSKVTYKSSDPLKWKDFYPSGKIEYLEEYNKSLEYYLVRQTYYESGQLETNLDMDKLSKKVYISQEFNKKGKLIEEGYLVFSSTLFDYIKIGKWSVFDANGNLIREENYINGKLNKEKIY